MKFIIDAQLPKSLASLFIEKGYDVIHTLELPKGNKTTDEEIIQLSLKEKKIVISKDYDFFDRYLQKVEPHKLIYLTTGNIKNKDLIALFERNLDKILEEIQYNFVVEITKKSIITIL